MNLRILSILTVGILMPLGACGNSARPDSVLQDVLDTHSKWAISAYEKTLSGIDELQKAVDALAAEPNDERLAAARAAWIAARTAYAPTEVLRFFEGPIERVEGLINAWPLDESYLDKIVDTPVDFPELTPALLRDLNERDGEKNIATGWHAIEYLLWGPDRSQTGPGDRKASYFVEGPNAPRRRAALKILTSALHEDLAGVVEQWRQGWFTNLEPKSALRGIFQGITMLAGDELAGERIAVALETKDQEEEQSCFSDTTHIDHLEGARGIATVYGTVHEYVSGKDADQAKKTRAAVDAAVAACEAIPAPFDQAILTNDGRELVNAAMLALEAAAKELAASARVVGVATDYEPK